jgi:tetratricopeptide (TPR) repeat protein
MRLWSVPPLLALLCAFASLAGLRAADDPGGVFLQAYQSYKSGEKLESEGKPADALQKYRFCASMLEQLQKANPDYEPIVIEFRLKKSRESIGRVQSLVSAGPADSSRAGDSPTPSQQAIEIERPRPAPSAALPDLSTGYRIPVAGQPVPAPEPVSPRIAPAPLLTDEISDSTDEVIGRGAINALRDQVRRLQLRLNQERQLNEELNDKLLGSTAREQSAQTETDRTKVAAVEAKARNEQLQRALDDLQHVNDQLTRGKGADEKRIAALESDLEAAKADVEVADEYNDELFAKLENAARYIDSSDKIRVQLLADRKRLSLRAEGKPGEADKLKHERDEAVAENEALKKQVAAAAKLAEQNKDLGAKLASANQQILDIATNRDELRKSENALREEVAKLDQIRDEQFAKIKNLEQTTERSDQLAEDNKVLSGKLDAAEKQLAVVSKSRAEREKIEAGLRAEIESVNKTLASMRGQLAAGEKRISELEKQLSDTAAATATTTGAMADENALLKSLVARQLGEQAKRQQARRLVEEEMRKLQIRSTTLVEKLDALGEAEAELTPREKKLFEQPVATAGGGVDFSLVVAKSEPTADLPAELAEQAKAANELAQQGKLAESRDIYEQLVRKAPGSFFAAVNLGTTERLLGNYPQAIAAFNRALELNPNDPLTLTNLGSAQFRGGDAKASVETLRRAIAADSASYLAHYLLALALQQTGDLEGARKEVARTLDLKSDYLPAVQLGSELGKQSNPEHPPVGGAAPAR